MRITVTPGVGILVVGGILTGAVGILVGGGRLADLGAPLGAWLTVALAALLHECGHILAARLVGVPLGRLRLDLFGARLALGGTASYRGEALIAAAGPLASLVTASLALPLARATGREAVSLFCAVSLTLAAVNLLPVGTLDGGRVLRCLLASLGGPALADITLRVTTALVLGGLWLLSVYALLRVGELLTVFGFTLCLLLRLIGREEKEDF